MTSPRAFARLDELPAGLALEIDALCDDFERHWQRSRRCDMPKPAIDAFLVRASAAVRPALRECLCELDDELRAGVSLPEVPGLRIEEEIGRGGMGVVYRARRMEDNCAVALKLIPGAEHARWSRWMAELADLRHPNLVPLEGFGSHDGLYYVVMPLVSGGDLKERLAEFVISATAGRAALRRVASLIAKVAGAVDFLHRRGILHRDLKPSNILLASPGEDEPLVCDFGLAGRLDEASPESPRVVGTPPYMAPEQREGRPLTPAADIWSIGAVLHELLTGHPPSDARESTTPRDQNVSVDEALDRICRCCLGHMPATRYATAANLADDLRHYLEETQPHNGEDL
jgi:serine/threonine protein kinase